MSRLAPLIAPALALAAALPFLVPHVWPWVDPLPGRVASPLTAAEVDHHRHDETCGYAPPAWHALTDPFVSDASSYEHRTSRRPFSSAIVNLAMGLLRKAAGGIETAFIAADLLFPALVILLAALLLGRSLVAATCLSSSAWLTSELLEHFFPWPGHPLDGLETLRRFYGHTRPLILSRTASPQLHLTLLLGACWLWQRAEGKRTYGREALAGAALGALAYTYYFDWTAALAALCLAVAWPGATSVERKARARMLAIAGLVSLPAIVQYLGADRALMAEAELRLGMVVGRMPDWATTVRLGIVASVGLALSRGPLPLRAVLVASSALTSAQVILGKDPQNYHYALYLAWPLALLWLLVALEARWRWIAPLAFTLSIAWAGYIEVAYARALHARGGLTLSVDQRAALDHLRSVMPDDGVVLTTDLEFEMLVMGHTGRYVYLPRAIETPASIDELFQRLSEAIRITGEPWPRVEEMLLSPKSDPGSPGWWFVTRADNHEFYGRHNLFHYRFRNYPDELRRRTGQLATEVAAGPLRVDRASFRVDRVVVTDGPERRARDWDPSVVGLRLERAFGPVEVYIPPGVRSDAR